MPFAQCNDVRLYYETVGEGDPLLFIHGLGSSSRDWDLQTGFFSTGYRTTAVDLRGHGRSDKPPGPYGIPLFAADTFRLLEALGIENPHVVGISMGGMIAFQMAADAPGFMRTMTIVNSWPQFLVESWKTRLEIALRFWIIRLLGMRTMGKVLAKRLFPKPDQGELRSMMIERWAENDKRAFMDSMKGFIGWSVSDRIQSIETPTLVVAADQDYTPVETKEEYVRRMPNAELAVIEDSRHAVPVEHPDVFNRILSDFLQKH